MPSFVVSASISFRCTPPEPLSIVLWQQANQAAEARVPGSAGYVEHPLITAQVEQRDHVLRALRKEPKRTAVVAARDGVKGLFQHRLSLRFIHDSTLHPISESIVRRLKASAVLLGGGGRPSSPQNTWRVGCLEEGESEDRFPRYLASRASLRTGQGDAASLPPGGQGMPVSIVNPSST